MDRRRFLETLGKGLASSVALGKAEGEPAITRNGNEAHLPPNDLEPNPNWYNYNPEKQVLIWKNNALELVATKNFTKFIHNPYLMACIYYSDQFLTANSKVPNNPDLTNRIIGEISTSVNPALKFEYLAYLDSQVPSGNKKMTLPLEQINFGKGYNHTDALDLFIPEGSPIMSMAEGIVLVADKNWQANKPMSSSSHNGGNTVVIYSPTTQRFFRYAHLSEVKVNVGQKISAGTEIGKVGHTGKNANKPGHGGHLHLDVNKINPAEKKSLFSKFYGFSANYKPNKSNPESLKIFYKL